MYSEPDCKSQNECYIRSLITSEAHFHVALWFVPENKLSEPMSGRFQLLTLSLRHRWALLYSMDEICSEKYSRSRKVLDCFLYKHCTVHVITKAFIETQPGWRFAIIQKHVWRNNFLSMLPPRFWTKNFPTMICKEEIYDQLTNLLPSSESLASNNFLFTMSILQV